MQQLFRCYLIQEDQFQTIVFLSDDEEDYVDRTVAENDPESISISSDEEVSVRYDSFLDHW